MNSNHDDPTQLWATKAKTMWELREAELPDDDSPNWGAFIRHPKKDGLGVIGLKSSTIIKREHGDRLKTVIAKALESFDNDPVLHVEGKKTTLFFCAEKQEHIKLFLERIQARIIGFNGVLRTEEEERWERKREKGKLCVRCLKVAKHKCPCLKERYCSKKCQTEDWALHKLLHNKD